ncbi:MAG: polyprenyl diphosphate synthase [Pseudomonadota bacterium]|nr:polyprenyl diphosphate synthase [Pseudomonadota bacterium]
MQEAYKHVAFIMDGNGRWATKRGLARLEGHRQGAKTVESILKVAPSLGLETVTFYAFSSENWKRPEEEVNGLMDLLRFYFTSQLNKLKDNNIRLVVMGDKSRQGRLSDDVIEMIERVETETEHCTGLCVNFCINYGGRDEIVRAAQHFADDVERGLRFVGDLDERLFSTYLDSGLQKDPDLIIRTGGDQRISNFLLWQCSYSEFRFIETSWPDFDGEQLKALLLGNQAVDRRFGAV